MSLDLHMLANVYKERIARAVEHAQAGHTVTFRVDGSGDSAYIAWQEAKPGYINRVRRVIASGSERGMTQLLPVVQAEYQSQIERSAVQQATV